MAAPMVAPVEVEEYPGSDGKPVAESDYQFTPIAYARDALRDYFRDRPDVYVAANLLLYYERYDRHAVVAPDVFVVIGAPNHDRPSFRLWLEPKGPDFVLEVTSRSTRLEDQGRKRRRYRALAVREYWQYDPTGDYLRPRLQCLRLVSGDYAPLPAGGGGDGVRSLYSAVLGLELRATDQGLRFRDPATGEELLSLAENREGRERAERERERAQAALQEAEARLRELRAALRREGGADAPESGRDAPKTP